jgi:RNA polymerase sigma-70 factor, ECF subfamily
MTSKKPITLLLHEVKAGGEDAMNELLPLVYDELRRLAGSHLRRERSNHTLQPTALVHEAYIRLMQAQAAMDWQSRAHFFGIAARLMRQVLIDHARAKGRVKRGGDFMTQIDLDAAVSFDARKQLDAIAVDDALTQLESLDERQARIVEMKFFAGMQIEEIGEVLQISAATVKREWTSAKLFLSQMLSTT